MKTRHLLIIGIIMMSTIPFVTFAILDRYSNYVEQINYIAENKSNEPEPGERSYIEPELKAKLEGVELDLREKVRQLHQGLPPSSYAVNLNHQTKEIVVLVENKDLIPKIEEMITRYPDDISIVIINGKITLDEFLQDKVEPIYDPYETRCGSGAIPYIPENWQSIGMRPSDETWETLDRHLMAQFFFKELQNRNIVFEPACFGVYTGFADAIDPPSYSMCSMVTASNGTILYLEGTIREFDVTYFDIDNEMPYQCDDNHNGCLCGIENEN